MTPGSALDRLFRRTTLDEATGCLTWTGKITTSGYAAFWFEGRNTSAHRVVWILLRGPIPGGLTVDHLCRNKLCQNVEHFELVTGAENSSRSWEHNRRGSDKTECLRGHALDDEANVRIIVSANGKRARRCRACDRLRQREYAKRKVNA
jgi:hypothetical protein